MEALQLGGLPAMQESVTVVGFPQGGDNVCVTKGVVSRLDRQQYSHGRCSLLTLQIDAPINRWAGSWRQAVFKAIVYCRSSYGMWIWPCGSVVSLSIRPVLSLTVPSFLALPTPFSPTAATPVAPC